MSKSTRSLVIAAAAASLFLAGCATQGTTDSTSSMQATPVVAPATTKDMNQCKNMASCKQMPKKHHHKKHKAVDVSADAANVDANKAADSTAAQ